MFHRHARYLKVQQGLVSEISWGGIAYFYRPCQQFQKAQLQQYCQLQREWTVLAFHLGTIYPTVQQEELELLSWGGIGYFYRPCLQFQKAQLQQCCQLQLEWTVLVFHLGTIYPTVQQEERQRGWGWVCSKIQLARVDSPAARKQLPSAWYEH